MWLGKKMGEYFSNQALWVKFRVISCSMSHGWPEMSSPALGARGERARSCLVVKGLFMPHSIQSLASGGPKQSFPSFSSRMVFSGRQGAGISFLALDYVFFFFCVSFETHPTCIAAGREGWDSSPDQYLDRRDNRILRSSLSAPPCLQQRPQTLWGLHSQVLGCWGPPRRDRPTWGSSRHPAVVLHQVSHRNLTPARSRYSGAIQTHVLLLCLRAMTARCNSCLLLHKAARPCLSEQGREVAIACKITSHRYQQLFLSGKQGASICKIDALCWLPLSWPYIAWYSQQHLH